MYPIGMFSKMNKITTKTLRHYDKLGLLKPDYVDPSSGYRFYTSDQFSKLHNILALKQMGLSLQDIGKIINDPSSIEVYLKLKESQINCLIQEQQNQLKHIQNYIKYLRGEISMKHTPIIKELPEVIVASMRTKLENYDMYFEIIPVMAKEMAKVGAVCAKPDYCFTIYHDGEYKETNIDVEICESVIDYYDNSDIVVYKKIDAVSKAACLLHKGPYSTLGEGYNFLFKWIKDNDYEVCGEPRESFIDGIWNKKDHAEWLTEIQIPIKKTE